MPELPEVETIRRGLSRLIIGQTIVDATHDTPKSFPNAPDEVNTFLIGARITAVRRRAKVLLIDLSTNYTLVIHLKMTGQLVFIKEGLTPPLDSEVNSESSLHPLKLVRSTRIDDRDIAYQASSLKSPDSQNDVMRRFGGGHPNDSLVGSLPDKSTRVEITFQGGSKLFFNDQRKFGWMRLIPTISVPEIDFMKRVGPEPLEDSFTADEFISRIRRRNNTTIKAAILDQTVLAGVGNIYADESLWGANIHPASRVRDISDKKLAQLLIEIKYVMNLSIEKGGSTDRNYVNAEGKKGSYIDFARVFRQEGKACPRCGITIEKTRIAGRGTHICPHCQMAPVE